MEQDSKGQAKGALMKSLDNALTLLEQFTPCLLYTSDAADE